MKNFILIKLAIVTLGLSQPYDIVIKEGRVIDPETDLDQICNIGIIGNQISDITKNSINGKVTINAKGLVVSPGFIDLHAHGQTNSAHRYQLKDGVTTALEMESGVAFIERWIEAKKGKSLVNFGATAPHGFLRSFAMNKNKKTANQLIDHFSKNKMKLEESTSDESKLSKEDKKLRKLFKSLSSSNYESQTFNETVETKKLIKNYIEKGALGIGLPVGYYLGASAGEIFEIYRLAKRLDVTVYTHTRGFGMPGIQEAMAAATTAGASVHIVHANSMSLGEIETTLSMVESAQENGLDITTEVYPYTAASTSLESILFDEGWKETLNISYKDLQWEKTGERLNKKTFYEYRKKGGVVIIHMMKPEWIRKGVSHPISIIASDGMPYAPGAHPRTAGTFSRILGKYVREEKALDLMTALKKITIMPAKRLEKIAPSMTRKGRLQVGADADITIFNPNTIIDKADFSGLKYSEGIETVIINGKIVVNEGKIIEGVFPGKPILSKYKK